MHAHFAAGGARGVHGDFNRLAFVFGLIADVEQKMGELHHAAGKLVGARFVFAACKQGGPMQLHHAAA